MEESMKRLHVGAAAVNQTPLDWANNKANIVNAILAAKEKNIELLLLPELSITGYGCEDLFLSPDTAVTALEQLLEIANECDNITVAVGLPFIYRNGMYNGVALISHRKIIGIVAKRHLANSDVHYESRWFQPWPRSQSGTIQIDDSIVPVGDLIFNYNEIRIGFEICEDAWVPNRPGRDLSQAAVDIILNPSASHFSFQKNEVRRRFIIDGSRAFGATYIYSNLLGNESGRIIYDGASLIASAGTLICESERFSYKSMVLTDAIIDLSNAKNIQVQKQTSGVVESPVCKEIVIPGSFNFTLDKISSESVISNMSKEEEFSKAVPLALFDYMRKSRSNGFVISLSGGADSSAVAVLVYLMIQNAYYDLGINFDNKLDYLKLQPLTISELASKLITCIYQGTNNSTSTTRNAAKNLASAINAEFHDWDINELVKIYTSLTESALDRKMDWKYDDLALQNIQARVRAPGVWMMANSKAALLVSTSNRSEAAVGYATMDGDTSGGLAPLAGIDKHFLRHWLRWAEVHENIPALLAVNCQQPTAELRPSDTKQTDEADLMPYDVLNKIEILAFRDRKYPREIRQIVSEEFPLYDIETITIWIKRFFTLWCRNQWKRERYAPSFHLDDTNLDPRSYLRFPILSGGFAKELSNL